MEKKIHQGRNITRFRQMLGLKQDALASALGDDWTQIKVSRLEAKEEIEEGILKEVAAVLKVPVEAITNFDEEAAINIISNTFNEGSFINTGITPSININPIEKWLEVMEENKKLYAALLKEKDEKLALMEKLLEAKK
ncbi:MAG: XRE family transcriptional regulator [Bacteroidetes bacterium]|nr:XRE family transcriptional regulator [Bacteroidota bacterium]